MFKKCSLIGHYCMLYCILSNGAKVVAHTCDLFPQIHSFIQLNFFYLDYTYGKLKIKNKNLTTEHTDDRRLYSSIYVDQNPTWVYIHCEKSVKKLISS